MKEEIHYNWVNIGIGSFLILLFVVIQFLFFNYQFLNQDIVKHTTWDCPGIGVQEALCGALCYVGCTEINDKNQYKTGLLINWDSYLEIGVLAYVISISLFVMGVYMIKKGIILVR